MSGFGFANISRDDLQFEDHLTDLGSETRDIFLDLRHFVKSLSNTVIEDVRPHRVVYAKTLNFRIFLDVQPKNDKLAIVLKYGRDKPESALLISNDKDLEAAKPQISQAFQEIR